MRKKKLSIVLSCALLVVSMIGYITVQGGLFNESDLITKGQRDSSVDLSELQLIHFTYNSVTDSLSGTKGDYSKYYNDNASDSYLNKGGNYEMAVRRLSQWSGLSMIQVHIWNLQCQMDVC